MKKLSIMIFVFCTAFTFGVSAQDRVTLEIAPAGGMNFGNTEYEMDLRYIDEGTLYRTRSLLEFPLGTSFLGLKATLTGFQGGEVDWKLDAMILSNMSDPSGKMYDHDWGAEGSEPLTKFSYTESNSELKSLVLEASGSKNIHNGAIDIWFQLGFDYHHYDYEIIDFEGWQLVDGTPYYFDGQATGILYVIDYYFPHAAVQFERGRPGGDWRAFLGTGVGAVFFSDEDDHVLRNKKATTSGTGIGLKADFSFRRYLGNSYHAKRPYIEVIAGLRYFNASGDQTQTWYGDDPASDDYDDTGDSVSGIPHDVRSLAGRIGLKLGFTL